MSAITEKIRSRGYWMVRVNPTVFLENRLAYDELEDVLFRSVVSFRGWPVPFIDTRQPIVRGGDWIGQDVDAEMVSHYEAWRWYTSAKFDHLRAISADWRSAKEATPVPRWFSSAIEVWEILYYLTEVFELAARLALAVDEGGAITIEAELNGTMNRGLVVGVPNRVEFLEPHISSAPSIKRSTQLERERLIAEPRLEAAKFARDFFVRFGWKAPLEQLSETQMELTGGR